HTLVAGDDAPHALRHFSAQALQPTLQLVTPAYCPDRRNRARPPIEVSHRTDALIIGPSAEVVIARHRRRWWRHQDGKHTHPASRLGHGAPGPDGHPHARRCRLPQTVDRDRLQQQAAAIAARLSLHHPRVEADGANLAGLDWGAHDFSADFGGPET